MTKKEAAIVSAYTGILLGKFSDVQEYVDSLPEFKGITTIALAMLADKIREAAKQDFLNIAIIKEVI